MYILGKWCLGALGFATLFALIGFPLYFEVYIPAAELADGWDVGDCVVNATTIEQYRNLQCVHADMLWDHAPPPQCELKPITTIRLTKCFKTLPEAESYQTGLTNAIRHPCNLNIQTCVVVPGRFVDPSIVGIFSITALTLAGAGVLASLAVGLVWGSQHWRDTRVSTNYVLHV